MVILVVEDEHKIASFVKKALEMERYTVEIASSGEEAMGKIEVNDYDLLILDIMLPKMDGFKLCQKVRNLKIHTPIIMLTAKAGIKDRIRGLDAGADDYLGKPFSIDELSARVRSLLRREKRTHSPKLSISDLELDPKSHEVKRGGQEIKLTSKEYKILDFLMRRKGQVCSRNMIGEHVWGYEFSPLSNVIDVHINNLRRKVDKRGKERLISTVRDGGYKIKSPHFAKASRANKSSKLKSKIHYAKS